MATKENLTLQLAEVELLSSMFPSPREFHLSDPRALSMIQDFVDNEHNPGYNISDLPQISFTIKLDVHCETVGLDTDEQQKAGSPSTHQLEVCAILPLSYPSTKPIISLSGNNLTKTNHQRLHEDLSKYVSELPNGDLMLSFIIQWLQEHGASYFSIIEDPKPRVKLSKQKAKSLNFSRMWIYSHHIYSKIKRKAILEYTAELHLTGFCMPGKPGMIVVEGYQDDVEDFWQRIRSMQWKRIMMKEREDLVIGDKDINSMRKFEGFEENSFEARLGKGRGAHGDRGLLYKYLEEKGCGHVFVYYFGVEGKSSGASESKESDSDNDSN